MGYINGATGATQTHEETGSIRGKLALPALLVQLVKLGLLALKVKKVRKVHLVLLVQKVKKVNKVCKVKKVKRVIQVHKACKVCKVCEVCEVCEVKKEIQAHKGCTRPARSARCCKVKKVKRVIVADLSIADITGDILMKDHGIKQLANPVGDQDAVNLTSMKKYVGSNSINGGTLT